jgi:hypothetical protein
MHWTSGAALIVTGLAVAAYGLPSSVDGSEGGQAARAFTANPVPTSDPPRSGATPVVVTVVARPGEHAHQPPQRMNLPKGETLVRELQKELRRVGCYDGEINGAWTQSTRRAMKSFTELLNASLPVDAPDAVLYAMLQGQREEVCGKPCPTGQAVSEAGRCVPSAIIAKSAGTMAPVADAAAPRPAPAPVIVGWTTTTTAAVPEAQLLPKAPPPEGRMALAGPREEAEAANGVPQPLIAAPPAGKRAKADGRRQRDAGRGRGERTASQAPRKAALVRSVYRHLDWSL